MPDCRQCRYSDRRWRPQRERRGGRPNRIHSLGRRDEDARPCRISLRERRSHTPGVCRGSAYTRRRSHTFRRSCESPALRDEHPLSLTLPLVGVIRERPVNEQSPIMVGIARRNVLVLLPGSGDSKRGAGVLCPVWAAFRPR